MSERVVGVDIGAETIKFVEIVTGGGELRCTRRVAVPHAKRPAEVLAEQLREWEWDGVSFAAATGRFGRVATLAQIPTREALTSGFRQVSREPEATLVTIGSRGFSVLEIRSTAPSTYRENSRCSQGTGNFLRQLVERFDLSIEEAAELAAGVGDPAPLSGRCPVILKTDMTHLANRGEDRARILAGLFDAVAENVQVLIKPRTSPRRVFLTGGVTRALRVREHFRRFADRVGMEMASFHDGEGFFLEALGCALLAAEHRYAKPRLDDLLTTVRSADLERLPPLAQSLPRVRRLVAKPAAFSAADAPRDVILGFDIGSTGSKIVALDAGTRESLWESYGRTNGQPVHAAQSLMQQFLAGPAGKCNVVAAGVTGSGREIVGSLLNTCYGRDAVFVLNEIAAHAEGALSHDARVDTIFEIGGQDAKYIRLAGGRVVDAAMNEACSAGTGSFIEEQGRKFADVADVAQLGTEAIAAGSTVALGQHCSVFMAEVIDEAVAAGVERGAILAGIHDSIVQNYLNRVKGSRSVGQVIFCQGMPFAADALAAAVARQTGSDVIVPPNPGTVGALGIALLTAKALSATPQRLDPQRFLDAAVEKRDTFVCAATVGCGGAGNRCRIDRILTNVAGERSRFTWGGGCALYDKGTRRRKLPDLAPDPFLERKGLLEEVLAGLRKGSGARTIGMADELQMKGLLPFFATFFDKLGLEVVIADTTDRQALKRGIEEGTVPFCAPMQQFHGAFATVAERKVDHLFLPIFRELPRVADEPHSGACPLILGGPDVVRRNLGDDARILSPLIDVGRENFHSTKFLDVCRNLAESLGAGAAWKDAHRAAAVAQEHFDLRCRDHGRRALAFCAEHGIVPVVVIGRPYTIFSTVLNSNVPAILREQGAIAIPLDCYPVEAGVPLFPDVYWAQTQRILRAAHQVRRSPGVYAVYCSNYSCGPDSFTLPFFAHLMEGKPFAVIETDGHSGDAGTKTRIEAFLHCVQEDLAARTATTPQGVDLLQGSNDSLAVAIERGDTILLSRFGPATDALAACLRGIGARAETLAHSTREALRLGRRFTSGKECLPMILTLGSIVQRLEAARTSEEEFTLLMPTSTGPCRFGLYTLLEKIVLDKLGWTPRMRIWSPNFDGGYFQGLPKGFDILVFTAITGSDLLLEALHHTRPVESTRGSALAIWERRSAELHALLEDAGRRGLTMPRALAQVANGRLFGVADLLRSAAADFAAIDTHRPIPTVEVVGEIYVRLEPFANDFVIDRLEERGIRARLAPFGEWLEFSDVMNLRAHGGLGNHIDSVVRHAILARGRHCMAGPLGWEHPPSVDAMLAAAAPYATDALETEAVLAIGNSLLGWRRGSIDAVVSVGPLECIPNKIAEAQFFHVGEDERLLSLSLYYNGDPIDTGPLDSFAFEVHERFRKRERAVM